MITDLRGISGGRGRGKGGGRVYPFIEGEVTQAHISDKRYI